jgi:hypothetical protein
MSETKKPKNIDAFPCDNKNEGYRGMTLRDYFASKALPEVLQHWQRMQRQIDFEDRQGDAENIAIQSYLIADAMLKQRELNDEN